MTLDEPTTGLDSALTSRIMAPLRRRIDGRTTVIITHNLMLARDADPIVVLATVEPSTKGTMPRCTSGATSIAHSAANLEPSMPRAPRPARHLADGYQVISRLSLGRDLEVYDAWSDHRACRCIIKRCRPDRADAALQRRIVQEGNLLKSFTHRPPRSRLRVLLLGDEPYLRPPDPHRHHAVVWVFQAPHTLGYG